MERVLEKYRHRIGVFATICAFLTLLVALYSIAGDKSIDTSIGSKSIEVVSKKTGVDQRIVEPNRKKNEDVASDQTTQNKSTEPSLGLDTEVDDKINSQLGYLSSGDVGNGITPYKCLINGTVSLSEVWGTSKARAILVDNGGSKARVARGETYAAFMDVFWLEIGRITSIAPPSKTDELFLTIATAYRKAYKVASHQVTVKNVEPLLHLSVYISSGTGLATRIEDFFDPGDLGIPESKDLRPFERYIKSIKSGVDISIMFQRKPISKVKPVDFIMVSIVNDLGIDHREQPAITSPIRDELLGYRRSWDRYDYWDEVNIKDGVLCSLGK